MMESKPICCEELYVSFALGCGQSVLTGERKVLTVRWDLTTDQLIISLEEVALAAFHLELTKQAIVSLVSRIYDPLGILTPIMIQLKIFLQELCEAELNCDQRLTGQPLEKWNHLSSTLIQARSFLISRWYFDSIDEQVVSCTISVASVTHPSRPM